MSEAYYAKIWHFMSVEVLVYKFSHPTSKHPLTAHLSACQPSCSSVCACLQLKLCICLLTYLCYYTFVCCQYGGIYDNPTTMYCFKTLICWALNLEKLGF